MFRYYNDTRVAEAKRIHDRWLDLCSNSHFTAEMRESRKNKPIIAKIENYRLDTERLAMHKVKEHLAAMQQVSCRSANVEGFSNYLECYGMCAENLLKFNMLNTSRKWNFNKYLAKQQVI